MTDPTTSTTRDGILGAFAPERLGNPLVRGMAEHLAPLLGADSLGERLIAWIGLMHWARGGAPGDSAWLEGQGVMVGGPDSRWRLLVTYAAQIVRSQLAAALSNVIVVAFGAYLFSYLWQLAFGAPFLDPLTRGEPSMREHRLDFGEGLRQLHAL